MEWLERHFTAIGLTGSKIQQIDAKESNVVKLLFDYLTGVSPTEKLPRQLLCKRVCGLVFLDRALSLGRGTRASFARTFSDDGSVDSIGGRLFSFSMVESGILIKFWDTPEVRRRACLSRGACTSYKVQHCRWFSQRHVVVAGCCLRSHVGAACMDRPCMHNCDVDLFVSAPSI